MLRQNHGGARRIDTRSEGAKGLSVVAAAQPSPRCKMLVTELSMCRAAHIILASASPRRVQILNDQLQLQVRPVPSAFMEDLDKSNYTPMEYVKENARQKALDVFDKCEKPFDSKHGRPPSLVIGADTVVVKDGTILEKPTSVENARQMLRELSLAGTHTVCTGVTLVYGGGKSRSAGGMPHINTFVEVTTVNFKLLSDDEIEAYVASGEPMDKAGGCTRRFLHSCLRTPPASPSLIGSRMPRVFSTRTQTVFRASAGPLSQASSAIVSRLDHSLSL